MSRKHEKQTVPGSERGPLTGARAGRPTHPPPIIEVTVRLRPKSSRSALSASVASAPMTRAAFAEEHGADQADMTAIESFAADHHLRVVETSLARRTVRLSGTVADLSHAFGVSLHD